ncbi:MAG: 50S ribosomal protein L4 [Patescibacteria group bacterium]
MAKVKIYNLDGQVTGDQELDAKMFEVAVKAEVVHQVVVAQQANSRQVLAHTKTKGEVRGGGAKPWRQKGTGRARVGSSRSPLWRGGGIIFGPRNNRNFSKKINKKVRNLALKMVLSDKVANDKLILLEKLEVPEGKTKNIKAIINKLPCAKKLSLISLASKDDKVLKAANNFMKINLCAADSLNVVDLLKNEYFVIDIETLDKILAVYNKK